MTKSNLILLAAITLLSMVGVTTHAQVAMNNRQVSSADGDRIFSKTSAAIPGAVNLKAARNFEKDYHQTSGAEWSVLSDKSIMCRFFIHSILYRAFYTPHGQWICTASSYDASKLDKVVYDKIKSVYYNSSIVYVDQIDMVKSKTIYVVEIQDEKSIRKLRVNEDEMEVIQEFEKK
jgi:hypothetical protein